MTQEYLISTDKNMLRNMLESYLNYVDKQCTGWYFEIQERKVNYILDKLGIDELEL